MSHGRTIRPLPEDLQNQIAAGEVVERPASVLKELLENSLDAGASRIQIHIRNGGQSLISVADNGHGIPASELQLAVTRHATSKLATLQDLHHIHSFGFRGEALPSIASVSRFRLSSSQSTGEGASLEILHGQIIQQSPAALPQGTTVEIKDLFANIPARLKFLKQPATEARKCAETVLRLALAHLHVEFELVHADRTIYHFLAGQSLADRLAVAWPESIVSQLHELSMCDNDICVRGLSGHPSTAQGRAERMYLYVNNRPVLDKTLLGAVREAYRGRILGKEYPQAVIFLDIPPDEIDVNVHPAKTEIRFQDERHIFLLVRRALVASLDARLAHSPPSQVHSTSNPVTERETYAPLPLDPAVDTFRPVSSEQHHPYLSQKPDKFSSTKTVAGLFVDEPRFEAQPAVAKTPAHSPALVQQSGQEQTVYLGQIARTYLVLASPDGLRLMDQHAAHERILFDNLQRQSQEPERQALLMPLEIHLHPSQAHIVQELWSQLQSLGFSLELSTPGLLLLRAIPSFLTATQGKEFIEDVLASKPKSMEDLWAVMACKSAIKAGDILDAGEAWTLIEAWQKLEDRHYCPHGRPVEVRWSLADLEKLFKRRP